MIHVYGLKNCDSCRKAIKWLSTEDISLTFHDFGIEGLDPKKLDGWLMETDWNVLLNRRGMTWRKIEDIKKQDLNKVRAVDLMLGHLSLIKRPVFEIQKKVLIGATVDVFNMIKKLNR